MPRIGGKKLYKLVKGRLPELCCGVGRDKFFAILKRQKLLVKPCRKFVKTTNSRHRFRRYKNVLKSRLITAPNQAWVSDITYLRVGNRFVYLFLITDAYSRKIVGWHLSDNLSIEEAVKALKMAILQSKNTCGVIHHSDRGLQYCNPRYTKLLRDHQMTISMTEENHCYENSKAERVNGILKQEFLLSETFPTKAIAYRATKEAITTYNNRRPHWSLNLLTPVEVHEAA